VDDREIQGFLAGLDASSRVLVTALRAVIQSAAPGACETLLWGGLSYHRPAVGGRVKGAVCQITAKRGAVRLEFIHGVRLPDPGGLLRGDGVSKRSVTITSARDARRPEIAALVRAASAFVPGGSGGS